ncbi:MAG: diaminopimelate epimerase [Planctomycetes bacterium]|nr:diaminopimelate epimerase [Planctomycetota bacterium]
MRFVKMHGIGNDYVYVNGFKERVADPVALAMKVADRHLGVGGDGLIMVLPPEPGVAADVRMRMFNADGSESEMCGNGIRCVCKLAHDHGISRANPMRIQTGRGVLTLRYTTNGDGKVAQVTVDMGEPIVEAGRVPVKIGMIPDNSRVVNFSLSEFVRDHAELRQPWADAAGLDRHITCVSMGNPHVMLYCTDAAKIPLELIGPVLEKDVRFPRRINVHFVQVHSPGEVTMRTWERGSGITLACGTGASAVCVAGVLTTRSDRKILAHLPGGDLTLEWKEADGHVYMTGPATEVFTGEWPG